MASPSQRLGLPTIHELLVNQACIEWRATWVFLPVPAHTVSFKAWNCEFQGLKLWVSRPETVSFKAWNCEFQGLKLWVSRPEIVSFKAWNCEFQGLKLWQTSSNSEAMSPSLPALPSLPSTVWQDTVFPSRANPFPVSRWWRLPVELPKPCASNTKTPLKVGSIN